MKPLCELSLIVAVSSGPGIIAPEKAMIKEETKIVISSHTVYIRPIQRILRALKNLDFLCRQAREYELIKRNFFFSAADSKLPVFLRGDSQGKMPSKFLKPEWLWHCFTFFPHPLDRLRNHIFNLFKRFLNRITMGSQ